MTHQPHNPGYPAPPQPGGYGAVPPPPALPQGPSKLPAFLTAGVALLGLLAYLASFGPMFNINTSIGPFGGAELTASGLGYWTMAALVAALLAAVGMVAKGKNHTHVVAVAAVLGLLLVVAQIVDRPSGVSVGWALWLVLLLTLLQAGAAIGALLIDSGVITAPAPRPRYNAYGPYGPPPAGYYGQPVGPGPQQPVGYPPFQGGGYVPGSHAQRDVPGAHAQRDDSPETPPSGFPSPVQQPSGPTQAAPNQTASTQTTSPDSSGSSGSSAS